MMNKLGSDLYHQPLNAKLLAKREETEKLIVNEFLKIQSLFQEKQKNHNKLLSTLEILQEESNELLNRSALISGEIAQLKYSILEAQNLVQEILCKIDELVPKQWLANMVQEKEKRTLQLFYDKMEHQKQIFNEFWEKELKDSEILELNNKKIQLIERKEVLQEQINWLEEKGSESKIVKLTEECMILRKRNAALFKRKSKILEQLERKLKEKRREIATAKINMTFTPL